MSLRSGNTVSFEEMLQRWRAVGSTVSIGNLTGPRFKPQTFRSRDEPDFILNLKLLKTKCLQQQTKYYLANNGCCGLIYSILLCFYFTKKTLIMRNAVEVFLARSWKLQAFFLFFFSFARAIYSNKGFILSFSPIKCC